jgi:multidrug efflux pump subunit AcrA (membrane-fusion protein)
MCLEPSPGSLYERVTSVPLQSGLDDARSRMLLASAQTKEAALNYQNYGDALMESNRTTKHYSQLMEMTAALELKSPLAGTVLTPKVLNQLGAYLKAGSEFLVVASLDEMRARIYLSEYDMYKIRSGAGAKLQFDGKLRRRDGLVSMVSTRPAELSPLQLQDADESATMAKPHQYYFADIVVENPEHELKPGMTGMARIYGRRRSVGGMALDGFKNFWGRKLW